MLLTSLPDDVLNGVSSDGASDEQILAGDDGLFLHRSDEGKAVDVDASGVLGGADLGRGDALVQAAVVGDDGADVEV